MRRTPTKTAIEAALKHWSSLYGPPDKTTPHDLSGANAALDRTLRQEDSSTADAESCNQREGAQP